MIEEDLSGRVIEGYNVIKPIGQGKFATVYKAETVDKKVVALKKIKIFEMNDAKLRDKCLKEVKLMEQLHHPNIICYLDNFIANNELIIITEWAEKGDLKRMMKLNMQSETPLEESRIWDSMQQIAEGLHHMHGKRIMHRDLKPANILITADDVIKIGDFGLGRVFSEETVEAYSKVGTPLYMSPELLVGEGYDMKSDVWSLGCIIYEMCEMRSPFRDTNQNMSLMDLFNNITKGEYKPIEKNYSDDLKSIVQAMIVVDPNKRIDLTEVIEACKKYKAKRESDPKIDATLIMDDIAEKLNLLDYTNKFCAPRGKQPIHRWYFAFSENVSNTQEKFHYFLELCYWLMENIAERLKSKNSKMSKIDFKLNLNSPPNDLIAKLIEDAAVFSVKMGNDFKPTMLIHGSGDAVCFILNELLNRDLIQQKYKFLVPDFSEIDFQEENGDLETEEVTDDVITEKIRGIQDADGLLYDEEEEMVEEEADGGNRRKKHSANSANNLSNSTSATSTYSDQFRTGQRKHGSLQNTDIEENQLQEVALDSVEWAKEVDRVGAVLSELQKDMDKAESSSPIRISPIMAVDEYADTLNRQAAVAKRAQDFHQIAMKVRYGAFDKQLKKLETAIDAINKGERKINEASAHLIENLKDIVTNKKAIYSQLREKTDHMKDKIGVLDDINKKIEGVSAKITKREAVFQGGNERELAIKAAIRRLKGDIVDIDRKIGVARARFTTAQKISLDNVISKDSLMYKETGDVS